MSYSTLVSDERRFTAYHEAGHAVAIVRHGSAVDLVTIVRREDARGQASGGGDEDLVFYYAGYAVDLERGRDPSEARAHASFDFERARDFDSQHDEVEWIEKSRAFVRANWAAIELIAVQLLEHDVLFFDELHALVEVADGESTMEDVARMRAHPHSADDLARRRVEHIRQFGT